MLNRQRKQEPAFSHPLVKRMLPWKSETASLLFLTCSMLFFFFSPPPRGVFMMLFFFRSEITNTRRDASEETQTGRAVTGRSAQPSPLTLRCPCGTCAGLRGEGGETAPNLGHPAPKKSPASMQQWQRDHSAPCQCCRAGSLLRRWGGGGCTNRGGFCTPNSSGFCNSNFSVFLSPNSNGSPPGWDAPSPSHCPSTCPMSAGPLQHCPPAWRSARGPVTPTAPVWNGVQKHPVQT